MHPHSGSVQILVEIGWAATLAVLVVVILIQVSVFSVGASVVSSVPYVGIRRLMCMVLVDTAGRLRRS